MTIRYLRYHSIVIHTNNVETMQSVIGSQVLHVRLIILVFTVLFLINYCMVKILYYIYKQHHPFSDICKYLFRRFIVVSIFQTNGSRYLAEAICHVETCLKDILAWMHGNMLKEIADKTEVIVYAGFVNGMSVFLCMSVTLTLSLHHLSEIWAHSLLSRWT